MKKRKSARSPGEKTPASASPERPGKGKGFVPVVGIGASAGGLEALKEFFGAMPADSGMAFVVVQHLEPSHESRMAEILGKCTPMKVVQAQGGMGVEANAVYTNPPGRVLSIGEARLVVIPEPPRMTEFIPSIIPTTSSSSGSKAERIRARLWTWM